MQTSRSEAGAGLDKKNKFTIRMQRKLVVLFCLVLLAFAGLSVRLILINRDNGDSYKKQVLSQQQYSSTTIPYKRGEILDNKGTKLASSEKVYDLVLDIKQMNNKEDYVEPTIQALEDYFSIDGDQVRAYAQEHPDSQYYVLKKRMSYNEISDYQQMKQWYGSALTFVLGHKKGVLGGIIGLFVVALGCFFTLGRSFLPPFNEGSFTINISSLPGISLEESDKMGHRAEELLLSIPEIQTVARKTGRAELDEHALGVNVSEIEAPFELKDRSRSELVAEVREKLGTIVGANVEIGQPISHRIDAMLSGTKANIAIKLFGDDLNRMFTLGNEIKSAIQGIPGIADLNVEQQIERPQLVISPKREMLAKYGISLPEFSEFVNVCLAGEAVSQVYEKGKSFDLTVRVKDNLRDEMEKIRNLKIDTGDGQKIPLNYVAEIRSAMGPNTISRENVKRKIVISANVADRDLRSVVNDIQAQVDAQIKLPEGYHIEYGGQFESEQAASRTLALTSFMSIVVIFLLLYHEFRSVKESAIILINLPLALIGGVFALLITTGEVSIPAIIGFISLFGIATRNGMLLISHYNHLQQEEGYGVYDSVIRGSLDRLNPILMTALSSALALIPLALSGDLPGNEIQSPMAKVILGGLLTSTFLNGFIIPIVYLMMHHNQQPKTSDNE